MGSFRLTRQDIKFDMRTAMNLLMSVKDVNPKLFKNPKKSINSFNLLSEILPPLSAKFKNGQDGDGITNVINIRAGNYKHGQLDKDAFGFWLKRINPILYLMIMDFKHRLISLIIYRI